MTALACLTGLLCVVGASTGATLAETVTLTGKLTIAEDDDWNIVAVKLTLNNGAVYNVVLNETGLELGDKIARKTVEVTGAASEKDGEKWLTVLTYKEVKKQEKRQE